VSIGCDFIPLFENLSHKPTKDLSPFHCCPGDPLSLPLERLLFPPGLLIKSSRKTSLQPLARVPPSPLSTPGSSPPSPNYTPHQESEDYLFIISIDIKGVK